MDLVKTLLDLRPYEEWKLDGETYTGLTWLDQVTTKPTEAELIAHEQIAIDKLLMNQLREERTKLLEETDFYALSDNTMSVAMAAYRQALKDVPNNVIATTLPMPYYVDGVFTFDSWPTKPV